MEADWLYLDDNIEKSAILWYYGEGCVEFVEINDEKELVLNELLENHALNEENGRIFKYNGEI